MIALEEAIFLQGKKREWYLISPFTDFFFKDVFFFFERPSGRDTERSSIGQFTQQTVVMTENGHAEARSRVLHLGLPRGGATRIGVSSAASAKFLLSPWIAP